MTPEQIPPMGSKVVLDMSETTTIRARFSTCGEVRSFFADRYRGMPLDEINIRRTCENHGLIYTPPLEYITPLSDPGTWERFWCEA